MNKKYEMLKNDTIKVDGGILYRIKALKDFGSVKMGDLGGYIEKETNLSHDGNCWVFDNARVSGKAWVFDNARVSGKARVSGNACVSGDAKVFDNAWVFDNARVFGDAYVFGNAKVFDNAWVYGNAYISGNAKVFDNTIITNNAKVSGDACVSGNSEVCDNARVSDNAWVYGDSQVYGDAEVHDDAKVYGKAQVSGNAKVCDYANVHGCAKIFGNVKVSGNAKVYGKAQVYGTVWICDDAEVFGNAEVFGSDWVKGTTSIGNDGYIVNSNSYYNVPYTIEDGITRIITIYKTKSDVMMVSIPGVCNCSFNKLINKGIDNVATKSDKSTLKYIVQIDDDIVKVYKDGNNITIKSKMFNGDIVDWRLMINIMANSIYGTCQYPPHAYYNKLKLLYKYDKLINAALKYFKDNNNNFKE